MGFVTKKAPTQIKLQTELMTINVLMFQNFIDNFEVNKAPKTATN